MNVYDAIMRAADHIERNPQDFNFGSICIPGGCETPGCALGWISHYMGFQPAEIGFGLSSYVLFGEPIEGRIVGDMLLENRFYGHMDNLTERYGWRYEANKCAAALREYAQKYHGEQKPKRTGIPADIRAMFATRQANPDAVNA